MKKAQITAVYKFLSTLISYSCLLMTPLVSHTQCPDEVVIQSKEDVKQFLLDYPDCRVLAKLIVKGDLFDIDDLTVLDTVRQFELQNTFLTNFHSSNHFFISHSFKASHNTTLQEVSFTQPDSKYKPDLILDNNRVRKLTLDIVQLDSLYILEKPIEIHVKKYLSVNAGVIHQTDQFEGQRIRFLKRFKLLNLASYNNSDLLFNSYEDLISKFDLDSINHLEISVNTWNADGVHLIKSVGTHNISNGRTLNLYEFLYIENDTFNLILKNNVLLSSLSPFQTSQISSIHIENCGQLRSLFGINFIDSIGDFQLINNANLHDISAIENVRFIASELNISNNPKLELCQYQAVCDKIINDFDSCVIGGNLGICSDKSSVWSACVSSVDDKILPKINIHPNPAQNEIFFHTDNTFHGFTYIRIFDSTGTLVTEAKLFNNSGKLDVSTLNNGLYYLKICSDSNECQLVRLIITR